MKGPPTGLPVTGAALWPLYRLRLSPRRSGGLAVDRSARRLVALASIRQKTLYGECGCPYSASRNAIPSGEILPSWPRRRDRDLRTISEQRAGLSQSLHPDKTLTAQPGQRHMGHHSYSPPRRGQSVFPPDSDGYREQDMPTPYCLRLTRAAGRPGATTRTAGPDYLKPGLPITATPPAPTLVATKIRP